MGTLVALRFFHSLVGGKQNDLNEENDSSCTQDSLWDLLLYTDLFGDFSNRTTDREDVPTLCVSGKCLFGKVEIDRQ